MVDLAGMRCKARALRRRIYRRPFSGVGAMPHFAKLNALARVFVPNARVIETGTYLGDTTRYFAARGHEVHTIEVSQSLSERVFPGLKRLGVSCYLGDSAVILRQVLQAFAAANVADVNFWLDGHWSGGVTGTAPEHETPIRQELESIANLRNRFKRLVVAVDDVRCFGNDPGYPGKKFLVDWAVEAGLNFYFLADIFVASTETYADL